MKSYTCLFGVFVVGCSAGGQHFDTDNGSDGAAAPCNGCDAQVSPHDDGSSQFGDSSSDAFNDGATGVTTVYANTDDTLYSLNPSTNAITTIGTFAGMGGTTYDSTITDLAVDATGNVYVNTETVVYSAVLPTTLPGTVQLTKLAAIAVATDQSFYALAFAPAGALGTGEVLIGGDGDGELYSISTTNGATQDLGSFGTDPSHSGYNFALSGDLVFYMDATNTPTGLATVRPCKPKTTTCLETSDYLVAVDMAALKNAYTSNTPATSVRKGIYGGSSTSDGAGTGYGDLFGLGAWEGNVFAFARKNSANATPLLISIDTTTGQGSVLSSAFTFTNGWSGAGVTTTVTITVPPPPN